MTVLLRSKIFLVLLSLLTFSSISFADTVNQEKAKLASMKQALSKQQQNYSDIQSEIKDFPEKLKEAQSDVQVAESELAAAKSELQNLKIEASKPGSNLERDIKLKEHALTMAERRSSREQRNLERVQRDEGSLGDEASKIKNTVDRLSRQVSTQERVVAETEAQAAREELAIKTPKPSIPVPAPVVIKTPVERKVFQEPEPIEPVAPPQEIVAKQVITAPQPISQPVLSEQDYEAYLVAERITKELSEKAKIGGEASNLTLTGSDIADTVLTHVGDKSFKGETTVVSGSQRIRVNSSRFKITVPEEDDGETYVFVVDNKKQSKLKIYYFKKQLTELIGLNPTKGNNTTASVTQAKTVVAKTTAPVTVAERKTTAIQSAPKSNLSIENLSESDKEGIEIAKEQKAMLDELKQLDGTDKPFFDNLVLSGRNLDALLKMEYLLHGQYAAEATVNAGRQLIKVNTKKFRISIPEADDGEIYIFYIDANNPTRLKLTYFKKSLLDLI